MNNTKKAILLVVCMVAVATAAVFGTLAFLLDNDSVVNTFTVGDVQITVDESKVNPDGTLVPGADRVQENEYHLLPGFSYVKDPTVTLKADSEDSYIRMIMTVHNAPAVQAMLDAHNLGDFSGLIGGWDQSVWLYEGYTEDSTAKTISFEFRYKEVVTGTDADQALPPLFTELIVPGEATGEEMKAIYDGGFKMEVFGHAIQADGFDDEDAAWAAFDAQVAD